MMEPTVLWRGKCIGNGNWVRGRLIRDEQNKRYIAECDGDDVIVAYAVIPDTVGICVNLYDKNKEMCFSGDIVRQLFVYKELLSGDTVKETCICEVEWLEEKHNYLIKRCREKLTLDGKWSCYGMEFEIIGNIYDNPDLIK